MTRLKTNAVEGKLSESLSNYYKNMCKNNINLIEYDTFEKSFQIFQIIKDLLFNFDCEILSNVPGKEMLKEI